MIEFRRASLCLAAIAALALTPSCGIYGGGGGGATADVRGSIDATVPDNDGRDIVIFAYRIKDGIENCEEADFPERDDGSQEVVLEDGETEFEIRNVPANGAFVIVFLLDEPGKDSDGRIDEGDPIAILNDPDCILADVPNKYIVQADDVRINFGEEDEIGFPAPGRAEAGSLSEAPE